MQGAVVVLSVSQCVCVPADAKLSYLLSLGALRGADVPVRREERKLEGAFTSRAHLCTHV